MTFFYRGKSTAAAQRSRAGMRIATSLVLIAYPLACIGQLIWPDQTPEPGLTFGERFWIAGLIIAFGAFIYIAPSYLQRIAGEVSNELDEFELALRRKAYAWSYMVFTAMTLIGLIYLAIALDASHSRALQLWTPTTFDHWNGLIWGAILYAFVLPTAYLAWAAPRPDPFDDEAEA